MLTLEADPGGIHRLLAFMTSAQCQQTTEDWLNKGDLLLNSGKYNEAIEAYNKAIEAIKATQMEMTV